MKKNVSCKNLLCITGVFFLGILCAGCSSSEDATVPTAAPSSTATPSPEPTATPTPTISPTPTPVWSYQIVQNGYYNASASWDDEGNFIDYPAVSAGAEIYYNDFDEYYNNFVYENDIINDAELFLSDEIQHSGDNSIKVSNREASTKGFSGFALTLDDNNAISLEKDVTMDVTFDFWAYYQDDFGNGVGDTVTFALWSNCAERNYNIKDLCNAFGFEYDDYKDTTASDFDNDDDKANSTLFGIINSEYSNAGNKGYVLVGLFTVDTYTWSRCEAKVTLCINSQIENSSGELIDNTATPSFVITTIGDSNSKNVSFYNPFYLDDIVLTIDSIEN
jgi:hypothetical protein